MNVLWEGETSVIGQAGERRQTARSSAVLSEQCEPRTIRTKRSSHLPGADRLSTHPFHASSVAALPAITTLTWYLQVPPTTFS